MKRTIVPNRAGLSACRQIPLACVPRQTLGATGGRNQFTLCRTRNKNYYCSYSGASDGPINPDGIIGPDGEIVKRAPLDSEESKALWKRAIKLPMYSVGLAPVLVSATAAFVHTGAFFPLKTLALCLSSVAIIAWLNLSNDVFDSATGVDKSKPESVVNLMGDWRKVIVAAHIFLFLGSGLLFSIMSSVVRCSHVYEILYCRSSALYDWIYMYVCV